MVLDREAENTADSREVTGMTLLKVSILGALRLGGYRAETNIQSVI